MTNEKPPDARPMPEIVGASCVTVIFVRDYVQMKFETGAILTFVGSIEITDASGSHAFPQPGSRDALCSLIGATVESADFWGEYWVQVRFAGGTTITVVTDPLVANEAWDWGNSPASHRWNGNEWPKPADVDEFFRRLPAGGDQDA